MKTSLLFALFALSLPLAAQNPVHLRGKVEDVQGTANQFVLGCTSVSLSSATIALNPLVGQTFLIDGTWNGDFANPAVFVDAMTPVVDDFEIGGGGKIGEAARFQVLSAPGDVALIFGSFTDSGFFPLPAAGAVLVDPFTAEYYGSGIVPGTGILQIDLPIPNDPALEGVTMYSQALLRVAGGGFRLTLNDCKVLTT